MSRRYVVNRSSLNDAKKIRETFMDAPAKKITDMHWEWPDVMVEVGTCEAVMYSSEKWQPNPSIMEDYKHLAEGPQRLLVTPGFIRMYDSPSRRLKVVGEEVELSQPMPDAFAVLSKILGIQTRLYEGTDDDFYLPEGDDGYYQIDIAGAQLGGAKHPGTGEVFLIVYTKHGVHCVIVGDKLDIQKDGIVG